jgi:putative nucleotidyltransferase with HDIG domain
MIKQVRADQVRVGMYIHQLDRAWFDHSFFSNRFLVKDASIAARLAAEGIGHVFIDTEKGRDLEPESVAVPPLSPEPEQTQKSPAARVALGEERGRARAIFHEATGLVHTMMNDVRLGRRLDVAAAEPLADKMIASAIRNPHALSSVVRIKSKDEYTFMHSVGVAAIMVAFGRHLELPEADLQEIVRGALLHDLGKILVPDAILNKPGRLTDEEFAVMRSHAALGIEVLMETAGFSEKSMEAVAMHHERNDGSGYPRGLKGDQITLVGQMSALIDVYDALTSERVYKTAWEPSFTLKKMLEWSPAQFDTALVQRFIRFLGIYPVGSLVELESGRLAIVVEQTTDLLRPNVLVIYNVRHRHYVTPQALALGKHQNDHIVGVVAPAEYGIDTTLFV